jgi:hypothetical protein
MTEHLIQKGLSRSPWANRLGVVMLLTFVAVLVISVILGLRQLGAA